MIKKLPSGKLLIFNDKMILFDIDVWEQCYDGAIQRVAAVKRENATGFGLNDSLFETKRFFFVIARGKGVIIYFLFDRQKHVFPDNEFNCN